MTSRRTLTRRNVLRGAGVALALPWLESLAPRHARGAPPLQLRFVPIYFPMGTAPFWTPPSTGTPLSLSPLLAPLAPLKSSVTVLSHVDNTAYAGVDPAPGVAQETASFLTCAAPPGPSPLSGKSVDQVIADGLFGAVPFIPSLQLGLSTSPPPATGAPTGAGRSISFRDASTPLGKQIDPQAVFDRLVSAIPFTAPPDPAVLARRATHKSVLDFILDDTAALQLRLGRSDRARLDKFQESVRNLEKRAVYPLPAACRPSQRPAVPIRAGDLPPGYDRNAHADLMIDLMVMALGCNNARVISLMLDDGGSDFLYDFLPERIFTATGSTLGTARVGGAYRDLAQGQGDPSRGYATINSWFVTKVASLCRKLVALDDGDGRNVLDNSVVLLGSGMHDGQSRSPANLPLLYVGGGGGALRTDTHLDLQGKRSLSDIYLTLIQKVFAIGDVPTFADSRGLATEILA